MIKNKSYVLSDLLNNTTDHQIIWNFYSPGADLNRSDTYLFKIDISAYYARIANSYPHILSTEEIQRALKFVQAADAERYISGKHLVRTILSAMMHVPASEIKIWSVKNQKPYVDGIEFNISHSENCVLLAVGPDAMGIDVEYIKPGFEYEQVLTTCFNFTEISFINNGDDPRMNFYTMWTRKEAILKATGEGLTDSLPEIFALGEEIERESLTYKLYSFIIGDDYVGSIAVRSGHGKINYFHYNY